jgi:precorrin-6A/cobalt-precorrin-6A reductase
MNPLVSQPFLRGAPERGGDGPVPARQPFRILLLGGTGDALIIANDLEAESVYSLAGMGRTPDNLRCTVRVGGFGGPEGLARYIAEAGIALVLDATHPYAATISGNARSACDAARVPYWALSRPGWTAEPGDAWQMVSGWDEVMRVTSVWRRVFYTVGREPLRYVQTIPAHQHWFIRCLGLGEMPASGPNATLLAARGPFALDDERMLFERLQCDGLVTKNSGGAATSAKLQVARERGMKVVMLARPALPIADRTFDHPMDVVRALREMRHDRERDGQVFTKR